MKRLPFSGFQSSLIADRGGSAIRPAVETLQKADRFCGRARTAASTVDHGFIRIFTVTIKVIFLFKFKNDSAEKPNLLTF
ncbi:MAG: hypothetical protein C4B57_02310 [Deltaproteobacteria bacterium]|nr:MAG: hypothetical protein C4B57_02310 [Deltaproteobacteria bacterium]